MTAHSSNRIAWQYHSDDGNTYRVAALKELTDQSKLGGEAWAGAVAAKPGYIKMRRITLSDDAGHSRVVPVYSLDALILIPAATLSVDIAGTMTTLASDGGPIAEKRPRRGPVIKQSS